MDNSRKQTLSNLKTLVNHPKQWEAFSSYIDLTIEQHQKVLEQTDDAVLVHRQQGAIAVLRKLKYLRDEVNGT